MGKNERIFFVDDEPQIRALASRFLENAGHKVVFQAGSMSDALEGIKIAPELDPTVAVLDGNLTKGDYSCKDGETLAAELHRVVPGVKIVAFSSVLDNKFGDVSASKMSGPGINPFVELAKVVTGI